jgi:uncharacterized repeat protein (TIGR01451 family)
MLSAAGFVQGFAYNSSAQALPGLSVVLYNTTGIYPAATATTPAATTTTNSDGYYQFSNVAPGTYDVVENSPLTTVSSTSIQTTVNSAAQVPSPLSNGAAIQVQVLDLSTTTFTITQQTNPAALEVAFQLNASATNAVGPFNSGANTFGVSTSTGDTVHQFNFNLTGNSGNLNNIYSFCSDLFDTTAGAGTVFTVNPSLTPNTTTQTADVGAQGYLYNNYGSASQSAPNGPALQLATWALEYDDPSNTSLTSATANFDVLSDPNGLVPIAQNYINQALAAEAAGRSENLYFLNYTSALQAGGTYGYYGQGQLSTDLLNLSISQPPPLATPMIITSQQPATATVGASVADQATVSGGNNPTGTVTFTLYNNPNATGTPLVTYANVALVSGVATSPGYTTTATGTDYWVATYNGDSNNKSVTSVFSAEPVTVSPATPSIITSQQPATATVGASVADQATVSGGYNPTGTVTFTLYNNPNGTGTPLVTYANVALVSGVATSPGYTTTAAGTDYWVATYNGNSNNNSVTSALTAEPVTVSPATPSITTTAGGTVVLGSGTPLTDTAMLSGGYNPTGMITFALYQPSDTTYSSSVYTISFKVSGDGSYGGASTVSYVPLVSGTYEWLVTYSGDGNNLTVNSGKGNEPESVTYTNVVVTKTTNTPNISVGQTANFTVTITNNGTATATGVTLNDPLPAGLGSDVSWTIVPNAGNPSDFTITGAAPNQDLVLSPSFNDTLAPGQSISVTITAATHADDVSSTCTTQCNISGNFNGTSIPGGDYIWFSCAANVQGLSSSQSTTVSCTGQTISFTCGTHNYSVPVSDCQLTFSPNCTTATTSCSTGNWVTCVPESGLSGNEFLCGAAFQVPSGGLPGGICNVTWNGNESSNAGCTVNCEWAAAVYSSAFSSNCASLGVKPCDDGHASQYKNSDNCGTPESYKNCVTIGACGNGGTNYTGSYCTPCPVTPPVMSCGTGTLPNTAMVTANYQPSNKSSATVTIGYAAPDVTVTKTADASCVAAGQTAGYTVTISNIGMATATGVTLSDPLPAGLGKDIKWTIDTSKGNPADFQITGTTGNQSLSLISSVNTLAAGASLTVHITATVNADDVASACTSQCSISSNFNGTSIPGGDFLWFSCDVNCQGLPWNQPTTINCSGQTISFTSGGQSYCLPVSNCSITYSPSCTTAVTACDSSDGDWVTCAPQSGLSGNQFLCGLAFQVPQGGLPGGIQNVTWSGNETSDNNCTINAQWTAAAYSCFTTQCSLLGVKPCDDNHASQYQNSDHCGTPENYKNYVIGGGCGGGGSNYTGSYSGTCSENGSSCGQGTGTLNNVATVTASNEASCFQNAHAAASICINTPITISGTKFNDLTGNGFSSDDLGQQGVTIDLYMATSGPWGSTGETLVATATTGSNGSYSFSSLLPGTTYYVQEVVPNGNIQTGGGPNGSAGNTYYTICAQNGGTYKNINFDDYLEPTCSPTNVTYKVTTPSGRSTTVTDLGGNTQQGDTITVTFTVTMTEQLTLVSYKAPSSAWNPSTAYEQTIYQQATTGIVGPGTYCLTVKIPNGYYQIDFVCGPAINVLIPVTYNGCAYGPDNANISYHAENRYISSDNGGTCANANLSSTGLAYSPAQVRTAYGINSLSLDGTGQTIAIVDAYDDPAIFQSLDAYDSQFGLTAAGPTLYQQYGAASSFLSVLNQDGQSGSPGTPWVAADPSGAGGSNWETEEALDVEWAHAMAPGAKIILVEAASQSLADLMTGVVTAANQPGVSVVSMSWGFAEGQSVFAQDEALYDGDFTTPAGHQGVTFVSSTGDYGSADPEYPAYSPNVVSVGGTSLYLNGDNSYNSESGWGYFSDAAGTLIGSGGGTSLFEPEPTYQAGVQSSGSRSTPDVSFLADPGTGAWVADTYNLPSDNAFEVAGGTSLSAPCWAGMFALVNQGRAAAGQATLNSTTPTDAQQALYSLPQADFNSIITGSNGGFTAAAGYNMVTGLGTPVANQLVAGLVAYNQAGDVNTTTPISVAAASSYVASANVLASANVFDALTFTAGTKYSWSASFLSHTSSLASTGDGEAADAFVPNFTPSRAASLPALAPAHVAIPAIETAEAMLPSLEPIASIDASGTATATAQDPIGALDVIFADYGLDDNAAVSVPFDVALPETGSDLNSMAVQAAFGDLDAEA